MKDGFCLLSEEFNMIYLSLRYFVMLNGVLL